MVTPDIVLQQVQGAVNFTALQAKITIQKGRVQRHNFYDFIVLRISGAPQIEVHIVP